jgi:hypothetical protein
MKLAYILILALIMPACAVQIFTTTKTPDSNVTATTNLTTFSINLSNPEASGFHLVSETAKQLIEDDPVMDDTSKRGMLWYEDNWNKKPKDLHVLSIEEQLKTL